MTHALQLLLPEDIDRVLTCTPLHPQHPLQTPGRQTMRQLGRRKPDERRPFINSQHCLTPDLFLRAIPELVGTNKEHWRQAREVLDQIKERGERASRGIESILEQTLEKSSYTLMSKAKDYADYLRTIAQTLPPYTSRVIEQELKARADELGKKELRCREGEVKRALDETQTYVNGFARQLSDKETPRRIQELQKVPINIAYYALQEKKEPGLGEPVAVSWRIKTLESIARKAFRKIIERIDAREAKRIHKLIQQRVGVEKLAELFKPYITNLQFEDANGLLFVYTTLESKTRGVERFMTSLSGSPIVIADLGGRESENYASLEKQKQGRPYEATHKTLVVPACSPDFVEVHFNTLFGALTAAFGKTRNSHQFYEQRKRWKRTGWSEEHFKIYEQLLEFAEQVYGCSFPPSA